MPLHRLCRMQLLLLLLLPFGLHARDFVGYRLENQVAIVETTDGYYRFSAYSKQMVEVSFVPTGEKWVANSHAVIYNKRQVFELVRLEEEQIHFVTGGLEIRIQKQPFGIQYFYNGKKLLEEGNGYEKLADGEALDFHISPDEVLYGGGARALGMNRRGHRLQLYNRAHYGYETVSPLMNYCLPIVQSSKMYMLHFDNAPIGWLDLDSKKKNQLRYETISGRKTFQLIAGDSWEQILEQYTLLTGRQPMPPRWTFGNFSSRFGYHSEKETRETVARFQHDSIPLDAVVIDIYWFGKDIQGHMGNLAFLKDSFPTPDAMMADFKARGIQTILVTEPFILTSSTRWQEAVEAKILATDSAGNPYKYDFYFGNTGLVDLYKPEARAWFWNIYKELTLRGVGGWWGDLGEPEVHPSPLRHATGTADELHNIYGHDWAGLLHKGYQADFPEQRPFILMRAGAAGSQRYGLIPWSGDVSRSWGGLQSQPEIALQMGMQGLGYMHSDLGGFAGGEKFDAELYIRWLQYGQFQPVFRPHAQEHIAPEPVFHDTLTKARARNIIEMRYRMLPYNYHLAFENNQKGLPFMRPLLFELPDDTSAQTSAKAYFWGKDMLVSPVLEAGKKSQEVFLPEGEWFDFNTGRYYAGGKNHQIPLTMDYIPTFVRAGAFITLAPLVQHTSAYTGSDWDLHYYHHESAGVAKANCYHDDGLTPMAFEKGQYELASYEAAACKGELRLRLSKEVGKTYKPSDQQLRMIVHGLSKAPETVKIGRKKIPVQWQDGLLTVPVSWRAGTKPEIRIKW